MHYFYYSEVFCMGDKVFNSNIRVKYNYDSGKVGNTVFRPYVYDSSGTGDYSGFSNVDMVHPLNNPDSGFKLRYDLASQNSVKGGKRSFLFFKDTKGVNSMFSASNDSMVNDPRINSKFSISVGAKTLNELIIARHGLKFDKGTLKYKDTNNNIYTVEGLGSFANETANSLREPFYGYGQPVKYGYARDSIIFDITDGTSKFTNIGYSCFMLLVHFNVRLTNDGGASDTFTMYCFVPVCFYDLAILNNKATMNSWKVQTDSIGTYASRQKYSTLFYITNTYNGVGSDANKRLWGYNGVNVSTGRVKDPSARNIPDVYWESPCGSSSSTGNFIPDSLIKQYKAGSNFKFITTIDITSYHMSEMSYKYYMYGEGQSQWRGKTESMSKYMVKWYPTTTVENANPKLFYEHNFIY